MTICKCESDEGRVCGRCHAWDDVKATEQRRAIDRSLTDEQIERIGRMWATKRFNCDDIRAYLATPSDKREARKHVETQPGSPNFDGAEAYEAYLSASTASDKQEATVCLPVTRDELLYPAPLANPSDKQEAEYLLVKREDLIEHSHPQYGGGLFATEDCFVAAPLTQSAEQDESCVLAEMKEGAALYHPVLGGVANSANAANVAAGITHPTPDDASDAARLDWLEQEDEMGFFYNIDHITANINEGFNGCKTLRAAIDAAMKEQKESGE